MGNLIFLIIIIVILRNVMEKKKKADGTGNNARKGTDALTDQSAVSHRLSKASESAASAFGSAASALGSVNKTKSRKSASKEVAKATGWDADAKATTEDISTTEYLRQKALEDQREHEEEARLEAMRLHRETGGRRAAQRHYDGDSIPNGMHLVKCGYCGAENLIGDHQKQSDFTCYFCREIL